MKSIFSLITVLGLPTLSHAVTTIWTGDGDPLFAFWSDIDNWDTGAAPTSSDAVEFNGDFFLNRTALDDDFTVSSITFSNQTAPGEIRVFGVASLTVNGNIINNTTQTQSILAPFSTGTANPTWDGPLTFSNSVNMGTRRATIAGNVNFNTSLIEFSINSTTAYGRFLGSGTTQFSSVTINIGGTFTGWAVDQEFDFTSSNFSSGVQLGTLPQLSEGLVWNTSQFLSQGILTVQAIPEPATFASFIGLAAIGAYGLRRRPRKLAA